MSKGSIRARGGLPGEDGVALRRPRLLPLTAEQQADAVALFSELLLAAARRSADGGREPRTESSPWRRGLVDGELDRKGLAA